MNFTRPALLVLPLLLMLSFPARAQQVEVGSGLVCDTQAQAERFVALYDGEAESTAEKVNTAERDPTACVVSTIAYLRGRKVAMARTRDTTFQIVPILVLGIVTEKGVQSVTPSSFFSAIEIDEIGI